MLPKILLTLCLLSVPLIAADEFTLYELQPPETHQFAITYDVTATREGAPFFFNPIRPGSVATKERVIERSSGKIVNAGAQTATAEEIKPAVGGQWAEGRRQKALI